MTNLAALTWAQVQHLTPEELTPILQREYTRLHGHLMGATDLKAALDMVAQGHWVPGLPARNPHPSGPEAGIAEMFGPPEPFLCHHDASPSSCDRCYDELAAVRRLRS